MVSLNIHRVSWEQGMAPRALYGWVSHIEPSFKLELMTFVFFPPLALLKYCQSGMRCYSRTTAGAVMKQQLSIENNFNENRRSFIDELECIGWAIIAESGEETTKCALVLQLFASNSSTLWVLWRREIGQICSMRRNLPNFDFFGEG